jgi:flagellar hook-associated protein 2
MGVASTTGLVSGINFDDIVGKLLDLERRPITLLDQRKTSFQTTSAEFSNLSIQISSLRTQSVSLSSLASFNYNSVAVTKTTAGVEAVSATVDRTAVAGTSKVKVLQLAQARSLAAQGFVDADTTAVASSSGTFSFRVGAAGKTTSVAVSETTTLTQLRDAINAANGDAVASIINDGSGSNPHRLALTAKQSGSANTITISANPTTLDFTNKKVEAAYAASTNSFAGTVSSNAGNNYTGTTSKSVVVNIVSAGAAGAATYKYSVDGGVTYLGANGATYNGSNAVTTQGALTNYIDGAATSNSTNEGVQIAFGAGTLAADDTFTVDVFNPSLQSAQDAVIQVGSLTYTKPSNTIADAIQGVTLNLLKTVTSETVDVTVSTDPSTITSGITKFISAYNATIKYLNDQSSFDPKAGPAKPLLGDSTVALLKRQLQALVTGAVPGAGTAVNSLSVLGVSTNKSTGQLTLDESKLNAVLADSLRDVTRLFVGIGVPSHTGVTYAGKTADTQPGTYAIEVLTAPTKATVTGGSVVPSGGIAQAETLTVSLNANATQAGSAPVAVRVSLTAGSTISDIVSALNGAFATAGLAASASNNGGRLQITATKYGDDYRLTAFSDLADDGNQSGIGTTVLTSTGVDISGRIGGHKATGIGEVLTSASGFGESGLSVSAPVAATGSFGTVAVTSGIADRAARLLDAATKAGGSIQARVDGLAKSIEDVDRDIARKTRQLASQETRFREQFQRLEALLGQFQTQSQALSNSLASLSNLAVSISRR